MGSAQSTAPGSLVRRLDRWAPGDEYMVGTGTSAPPETQLQPAAVSASDTDADRVTAQVR